MTPGKPFAAEIDALADEWDRLHGTGRFAPEVLKAREEDERIWKEEVASCRRFAYSALFVALLELAVILYAVYVAAPK